MALDVKQIKQSKSDRVLTQAAPLQKEVPQKALVLKIYKRMVYKNRLFCEGVKYLCEEPLAKELLALRDEGEAIFGTSDEYLPEEQASSPTQVETKSAIDTTQKGIEIGTSEEMAELGLNTQEPSSGVPV